MRFVPLYVQTEYAMLYSTISLQSLFNVAKENHYHALAITDNGMHGVIKFYNLCLKHKIQPMIGLRVRISRDDIETVILLYATSLLGYKNLMKIASYQATNKCATWEVISKHALDVLAILPSDENEVVASLVMGNTRKAEELLTPYKDVFDKLYVGIDLQTRWMKEKANDIIAFTRDHQLPPVAIHKSAYISDEDFAAYQILRSIDVGSFYENFTEKEANSALLNADDANLLFKDYPLLIQETENIAKLCHVDITFGQYRFPSFGMNNSHQYLLDLCKLGLNKRLSGQKVNFDVYKKRLFYELSVIEKMGFCDYFLIVYDFVRFAKQHDILVGPGRGSAPGSLVSYVLGITDVDPMAYDLLFERFLNPERISMPDIDVDFPDDRRDEVIRYVGSRFGKMRVAHITTFGTFGARLAIRDVARMIQYSDIRLTAILKEFPSYPSQSIKVIVEKSLELQAMMINDDQTKRLITLAMKLEGLPRHTSTHAAGIIIADQDLIEYTPLQSGMNELYQTQYEASDLEQLGLLKMDILGLRNLTIMKEVITQVALTQGKTINILKIPMDDKRVYHMIAQGDTDGIFQLESRGMRNVLRELKTSHFMDIVHANALFRPGPMEMIPVFVRRKFGEKVEYVHEDLHDILEPTYGTIVFQEQIMLIAQRFAGYTLGMADILRRAVSKKDKSILENERIRFVGSAMDRGYAESLSHDVYDYIVKFANYGFNKTHSVAYSLIAYQMGYLKVHYYAYFMAVLMTNSLGSIRLIQAYVRDCKKKGVTVFPPHINKSSYRFETTKQGIYFSLLAVNHIGQTLVNDLLAERSKHAFASFDDFVIRCSAFVNKRMISSLIHAGAFDEFKLTRKHMVDSFDQIAERQAYHHVLGNKIIETNFEIEEYSFDEASQLEKEALGFNLTFNLFIKYGLERQSNNTVNLLDVQPNYQGNVLFCIRHIKEITTKKGDLMAFLEVYDDTDSLDAVLFPQDYERFKGILDVGIVFIAKVKVDKRDDKLQLVVQHLNAMQ